MSDAPTTVHVAVCLACKKLTGVAPRRDSLGLVTCTCGGFTKVARYQLVPQKERSARKPRRER